MFADEIGHTAMSARHAIISRGYSDVAAAAPEVGIWHTLIMIGNIVISARHTIISRLAHLD